MPHKTKRQKLASQNRREQVAKSPVEEPKHHVQPTAVTVFKQDFRKSLVVIAFITALEIITYFGTMYYHPR
ncbi:hypothetical protein HYS00_00565 [Candidatus Microgenomates bacterium]|nr:hypothetical protein [Candidatus Microgenomates bacterium]